MYAFYLKKAFNIFKKVFIVLTVYLVVIGLFLNFTKKEQPKQNTASLEKINQESIYSILNNPQLNSTKDGKMGMKVIRSILCSSIGQACTNNPIDDKKNFNNSLFGMITTGIILPYTNPPASGIYWAHSGLQNAGFIPKTYATAGIGFSSIWLFMPIWTAFRNVTYVLIVIALITVGFMIMFRMKLNPQTVVNIENSLPKVIITMLMITFSFAIAGFMIDFMYVLIIFIIDIMSKAGNLESLQITNDVLTGTALWSDQLRRFGDYFGGLSSLWQVLPDIIRVVLTIFLNLIVVLIAFKVIGGIQPLTKGMLGDASAEGQFGIVILGAAININVGALVAAILSTFLAFILSPFILMILFFIIVIIGLLTLMFRIFFMLIYSYVQVLIYIMFAPIFLLPEAFPGQKGFSPWFRNILGNLLVFPITIALLLTIQVISKFADINITGNLYGGTKSGIFLPPLLSSDSLRPQYFIAIINAIFLMIIPDLAKSFKQMIIGKGGLQIPTNVNALWGAAGAGIGGGLGLMSQLGSLRMGAQALGFMNGTDKDGKPSTFGSVIKSLFKK